MRKVAKIVISFMLIAIMMFGFTSVNNVKAAVGDTIAQTFPDANMAQAVADKIASGDINHVITLTDITNATDWDSGFAYKNIASIDGIDNFTSLAKLDLAGNQITNIPDGIGNLTDLTYLYMSNNQITSLPDSIGNITGLENLYLGNNKLTSIPESIGNFTSPRDLYFDNNQLTSIPNSIWNFSTLQSLNLSNNQLTNIPDSVENLSTILNLYLGGNQLTSIPSSIGNLSMLRVLELSDNPFTSFPESIGSISSLSSLYLRNIEMTDLPLSITNLSQLDTLDVVNNMLGDDDSNIILALPSLSTLNIRGNQFSDLSLYKDYLVNPRGGASNSILKAEGNKITDLSFLRDVATLPLYTVLGLDNNQIADFSPLAHFAQNTFDSSSAVNQTINAEKIQLRGNTLSIDFPFVESGFPTTDYTISNGGYFSNGKIIWDNIPAELTELAISYSGNMDYFNYSVNYLIPLAHMYELSFDLNGGTGTIPQIQLLQEGLLGIAVTSPTRDGFTFSSWNTAQDGGGITWDFATSTMPANDVTLFAQWTENEKPITPAKPVTPVKPGLPKTGDDSNVIGSIMALLVAGSMILFLNQKRKKESQN